MSKQNFNNHARYHLVWHVILGLVLLCVMIGSVNNFFSSTDGNKYSASLLVVISVVLILIWWYSRRFALIAQDRAIRAEENLRHFILTGKPFDSRLRTNQIIALRFAPDEELQSLAVRAVEENLSSKQIKSLIQNWKADYYRV